MQKIKLMLAVCIIMISLFMQACGNNNGAADSVSSALVEDAYEEVAETASEASTDESSDAYRDTSEIPEESTQAFSEESTVDSEDFSDTEQEIAETVEEESDIGVEPEYTIDGDDYIPETLPEELTKKPDAVRNIGENKWYYISRGDRDYPYTEEIWGNGKIVQTYFIVNDSNVNYFDSEPYRIAAERDINPKKLIPAVRVIVDLEIEDDYWIDDTWDCSNRLSAAKVFIYSMIDDHRIYDGEARINWSVRNKKMSFFNEDYFNTVVGRALEKYQLREPNSVGVRKNDDISDLDKIDSGVVYQNLYSNVGYQNWGHSLIVSENAFKDKSSFLNEYGFTGRDPVKIFENETGDAHLELFYDRDSDKACYYMRELMVDKNFKPIVFRYGGVVDSVRYGAVPETEETDYSDIVSENEADARKTIEYFDGHLSRVTCESYDPQYDSTGSADHYIYREDGTLAFHEHEHGYQWGTLMGSDPEYDKRGRISFSDYDVSHVGIHYSDFCFYDGNGDKITMMLRFGEDDVNRRYSRGKTVLYVDGEGQAGSRSDEDIFEAYINDEIECEGKRFSDTFAYVEEPEYEDFYYCDVNGDGDMELFVRRSEDIFDVYDIKDEKLMLLDRGKISVNEDELQPLFN